MFPPVTQFALQPPNMFGPDQCAWSRLYDYVGGNLAYVLWTPTRIGTAAGIGFVQRFSYNGSNQVTAIEWAVTGANQSPNPTAIWANRATLSYQ